MCKFKMHNEHDFKNKKANTLKFDVNKIYFYGGEIILYLHCYSLRFVKCVTLIHLELMLEK